MIRSIKGKKFNIFLLMNSKKDFNGCVFGTSLISIFLMILFADIFSLYVGSFYSIVIGQLIERLVSLKLSLGAIILAIVIIIIIFPLLVIILSFLYIFNNTSTINLNKYVLLISNLLGIILGSFGITSETEIYLFPFIFSAFLLQTISIRVARYAQTENTRMRLWWLKEWAIYCGAIGGTSFYSMDLSDAVFDGADLRNTDLRETNLTRASFVGVKNLELALVKGTILEDPRVRNLLVNPRSGGGKNFTGANFQGANLRDANLRGANLTLVNAIDADFTGANFDEVCIQDWNISKNTKFRGVQCRRVYLKQNKQEPKPDSGEFQEGEFEKWVTEIQDTVDLIFRKGLSLRSLAFAIAQVSIDNEETQLTVESIAHKGDDFVVVKVGKQGNATKEKIHAALTNEYHQAQQAISTGHDLILRAKDDQIEQMRSYIHAQEKHIQGLISCIAQPREPMIVTKIYSTQQGDIMEGQKIQAGGNIEQGNRIIAGGDFTSTGSTTNLGEMEISGQVTNSIQQLQDIQTSDSQELAQILTDLQAAIQDEQNLPPAIKTVSLENVKILSEEAKKEPAQRSKSILEKAVDFLSGIGKIVGDTSKLAEVCKTHLPTLTKLLGF
jgi:uncharacterized protein YjbI with pentapeptide repeats